MVSLYIQMQNRRFDNRIHYETHIDSQALSLHMLKIVLQPIVENSVVHGILEGGVRDGRIAVQAHTESGWVRFSIRDNGAGIPRDKMEQLLHREGAGYGLYNVNRRLTLFYGADSGLVIQCPDDGGTLVTFQFPMQA